MRQTLFYIPIEFHGTPIFGFGVLLAIWAVASGLFLWLRIRSQGWNADTRAFLPVLGLVGAAIYFLPSIVGERQGLPIRGYGVLLLVAVFSAAALLVHRAKKLGFDLEKVLSLAIWLFVAGIVGARVFYVIQNFGSSYYRVDPVSNQFDFWGTAKAVLNLTQGGLVVFGSLIGGAIAGVIFTRLHRLPALATADLLIPSVILGMAIGRIGCFMNGCCFGAACDLPWSVSFPYGSPPYHDGADRGELQLHGLFFGPRSDGPAIVTRVAPGSAAERAGLRPGDEIQAIFSRMPGEKNFRRQPVRTVEDAQAILLRIEGEGTELGFSLAGGGRLGGVPESPDAAWTITADLPRTPPLHPAQLYSAIEGFLLLFVVLSYEPFARRSGELAAVALTLHPVGRFLVEMLRRDEPQQWGTGLTISQLISVAALGGAALLWWVVLRGHAAKATAAGTVE